MTFLVHFSVKCGNEMVIHNVDSQQASTHLSPTCGSVSTAQCIYFHFRIFHCMLLSKLCHKKKTKSYIITCNKCVHEYPEGPLPAYSGKMFCSYCKIALQHGIKIKTSQKQHFKDSNSIRVTRVIRINLNPKCRKFWFVTDTLF